MPNTLTISPEEFHFPAPYTNSSEMSLELTNPSADHYVAFKVKTIDPKRYIVKPTSGIIAPSQKATVKVTFQALASAELVAAFAKSKQKFMVQYRTVDGAPEANDTAATLMAKPGGEPMVEKKIECRYDFDTAAFKSTAEQAGGGVSTGTPGGAAEEGVAPFQSSSDQSGGAMAHCPLSRCLRFLLIALLVVVVVFVAIGYQYGDKVKEAAQKAAHDVNEQYERYRAQHG
ncbi:hypothetical protein TYRP_016653 [Tyrophagus putrescentiae]|nr:hypothetical protein TYRP_016653 [Tyrophagus putrescentiae]